ncbi:MAG: alpha/beta fold hydrolase [bacterium]|nr:alpha/beta fold hydrolase [bacterium]
MMTKFLSGRRPDNPTYGLHTVSAAVCLIVCSALAPSPQAQEPEGGSRESIFDRVVHIEEATLMKLPDVPPLCDLLDIWKEHVDIGACKLYCEQEGEGTPLVLIHGGPGGTHHVFHPALSCLKDSARLIYYDQRGCGASDYKKGEGYTIEQSVDDLDKLREALGIDEWVVLGHSFGGTVAQCYALKHPDRVLGLVLVTSSTRGLPVSVSGSRQSHYLSYEEQERIAELHSTPALTTAQLVFNLQMNGDWKRQEYYRPTVDQMARVALYEWVQADDFRPSMIPSLNLLRLGRVFDDCPIPTLIVEAKWDNTWTTDKVPKIHSCFPNAELVVFERSAHIPYEDEPDKFRAVMKAFIEKVEASDTDISEWKQDVEEKKKAYEASPNYVLRSTGYGRAANQRIVDKFQPDWLHQIDDDILLKLAFALYDVKRYEDALPVFEKMVSTGEANGDQLEVVLGLLWQGHMLDLLDRRDEAVPFYSKAYDMHVYRVIRHDQFGLKYGPSAKAKERLKTPFTRVENLEP